jgi:hypothetical protein
MNPDKLRLLFYGKVQALKGADTFVQAAIHLCQEFPERIDFDLVGGEDEGLVARFGSYQEKLLALIPPEYRDRFHFHGPIQPEMLPRFTQQGTAAVIPSKFETFCLAAHELNWIGIPLILNELPAFADYFVSGDNCLKFDGTVEHLVEVVQQILTAREPFTDWTWNAAALDVDPVATYEALLTTPPRPAPIVEPSEPATISVIIQHAGSLEKLQRCLDSLVANTYQPHQVIIKAENQKLEVQDLPSANTFDLELTSKGMAALQQVTGDYILPLTSDHWLHPHFLQQMTTTLRRIPTAEVVTTYRQEQNHGTDDEDTARYILPYEAAFPLLLYENLFSRSGTLCKRDIFDRFTDQMTPLAGNDWDFWLALVRADISIEIIPLVLLYQETFTVSGEINQMGQALITSHLLVRHPALVQKYALELLNIYAFELQNKERTFNHERKVFTTIQKEWTFRFNSQHIITRRFVQLTHLNILKAVRNPSIAWHKLRQWWQEQSSKGTE